MASKKSKGGTLSLPEALSSNNSGVQQTLALRKKYKNDPNALNLVAADWDLALKERNARLAAQEAHTEGIKTAAKNATDALEINRRTRMYDLRLRTAQAKGAERRADASFVREQVLRDRGSTTYKSLHQKMADATDPMTREFYRSQILENRERTAFKGEGGYASYDEWKADNPNTTLTKFRKENMKIPKFVRWKGDPTTVTYKPKMKDSDRERTLANDFYQRQQRVSANLKSREAARNLLGETTNKEYDQNMAKITEDLEEGLKYSPQEGGSWYRPYSSPTPNAGSGTAPSSEASSVAPDDRLRKSDHAALGAGVTMRPRGWLNDYLTGASVRTAAKAGRSDAKKTLRRKLLKRRR